jgi:hypothetical protein
LGNEYKLKFSPAIADIQIVCDYVFAELNSNWKRIASCLLTSRNAIGVRSINNVNIDWPQDADFFIEEEGELYFLAHSSEGNQFLQYLVNRIKRNGYDVFVNDDV